jgi:outer membrane lipoprotein-sorting protein
MKKLVSTGLIALLLVASVAVVPSTASAQGAGLVSSILNKMERNRQTMSSLKSGIWMQKYNNAIKDAENYYGDVQYIPGKGRTASVRVDWHKPAVEILAVQNGQYTLLKPRLKMAYQGSTTSGSKHQKINNVLGFGINTTKAELSSRFAVELLGEGTLENGGPHVVWLKLTPRGGASYKHAEVWVDSSTGMPLQTRVVERNSDMTTVRLINPQKNAHVSPEAFNVQLGSDIKIVKG